MTARRAIRRAPAPAASVVDRRRFFDAVRRVPFGGRLTRGQVDGMTRILDYREQKWPRVPDTEMAYILATVFHETARTMQPIKERGSFAYLSSKPYYPWYGRGLVQITWRANYLKWGIVNADDALQWDISLRVLFEGMIKGMFTGKKLADYIGPLHADFIGARRIVNGTDRDRLIAGQAEAFLDALTGARVAAPAPDAPAAPAPFDISQIATQETTMPPIVSRTLDMVIGNPLTGIPGAIGVAALLGPVLHAMGDALIEIGKGGSLWAAAGGFFTRKEVVEFAISFGLLGAKDHNKSGTS